MRNLGILLAVAWAVFGSPSNAFAAGEITGVVGGLLGGDLSNISSGNVSVRGAIDNGPLYGVRVGWVGRFVGFEGSFVDSPSGLSVAVPGRSVGLNGRVYYLEGNVLLIPIPGPVSPFFTVGAGLHSYSFDLTLAGSSTNLADVRKGGFNFGAGLKINIKALTLRGEVRDHITTIGPGDFDLGQIGSALGFNEDEKLHNVEIAAGIGIRF